MQTRVPSSWSRTSNRYCDLSGDISDYDNVGAAIRACQADTSCRYISDSKCDNQGSWETCRDSGSESTQGSCMYRKSDSSVALTFSVSSGPCTVVSGSTCFHSPNYPSRYRNDERCTIVVHGSGTVSSSNFETESSYDRLTIDGREFSGEGGELSSGDGVAVSDGDSISWRSDGSVTGSGFEVCSEVDEADEAGEPCTDSKFRCIEGPTDLAAFLFLGVLYHTEGPCFGEADALAADGDGGICVIYFVGWVVYFVFMLAGQCVLWLAMCAVLLFMFIVFAVWFIVLAVILFFYVITAMVWLLELAVMTAIGLLAYIFYGMWAPQILVAPVVIFFLAIGMGGVATVCLLIDQAFS